MDAVTLLDEARRDRVKIEVIDGDLQIEADASQKHWLRKLKPHKSEILALIDGNGQHQEPAEAELWPEAVRPFVEDVAERMQCPIDFPAIAMMIVLAGVDGRCESVGACGWSPRIDEDARD